jgi:vacuolar-type H+-ATPase catalytic subunit A/Vma1
MCWGLNPKMSVKLKRLAEMDPEYGEMLAEFFKEQGITDYLDMTIDEFLELCERKVSQYSEQIMGAIRKREHKI